VVLCCISPPFGGLSTTRGQITYVLLTRAPLYRGRSPFSLDLHVLSAPLTFVLSQDQTLQLDPSADTAGQRAKTSSEDKIEPASAVPPYSSLLAHRLDRDAHEAHATRTERDTRDLSRVIIGLSFQGPRGEGPPERAGAGT
jgi:hypothetical protein